MTELMAAKKAARAAALALRARLHSRSTGAARQAAGHALARIAGLRGTRCVAGYLPIRSELDPRPAMLALHGFGFELCVPVIEGRGLPLRFRAWRPGAALTAGPFGVAIPAEGDWRDPDVLLVPLLAFDAGGWRLGYGGGFYDRSLSAMRAQRPIQALGFAYRGQQIASVPHDATDAHLDAVVTETGCLDPVAAPAAGATA